MIPTTSPRICLIQYRVSNKLSFSQTKSLLRSLDTRDTEDDDDDDEEEEDDVTAFFFIIYKNACRQDSCPTHTQRLESISAYNNKLRPALQIWSFGAVLVSARARQLVSKAGIAEKFSQHVYKRTILDLLIRAARFGAGKRLVASADRLIRTDWRASLKSLLRLNWSHLSAVGAATVWRARMGTLMTLPRMAKVNSPVLKPLCKFFESFCPFCGEPAPENMEHMMLGCDAWEGLRAKFLGPSLEAIGRAPNFQRLRSGHSGEALLVATADILLGGTVDGVSLASWSVDGSNSEEAARSYAFLELAMYFTQVQKFRQFFLSKASHLAIKKAVELYQMKLLVPHGVFVCSDPSQLGPPTISQDFSLLFPKIQDSKPSGRRAVPGNRVCGHGSV